MQPALEGDQREAARMINGMEGLTHGGKIKNTLRSWGADRKGRMIAGCKYEVDKLLRRAAEPLER